MGFPSTLLRSKTKSPAVPTMRRASLGPNEGMRSTCVFFTICMCVCLQPGLIYVISKRWWKTHWKKSSWKSAPSPFASSCLVAFSLSLSFFFPSHFRLPHSLLLVAWIDVCVMVLHNCYMALFCLSSCTPSKSFLSFCCWCVSILPTSHFNSSPAFLEWMSPFYRSYRFYRRGTSKACLSIPSCHYTALPQLWSIDFCGINKIGLAEYFLLISATPLRVWLRLESDCSVFLECRARYVQRDMRIGMQPDELFGKSINETQQLKHVQPTNETLSTNETRKKFPQMFHLLTMSHLLTFTKAKLGM